MAKIQPTVPKGWQERLTFAGASIDADFGTYPSIGAALAAITIDRRAKGRQVAICDSSGKAMIYWWDTDDLTDNGLHLMENGLTSVSIYDVIGLQDALDAKADVDNVLNITPTEGQNIILDSDIDILVVEVQSYLISLTVTLPSSNIDGKKVTILFWTPKAQKYTNSTEIINSISIVSSTSVIQSILPTSIIAGDSLSFIFSNNNWISEF